MPHPLLCLLFNLAYSRFDEGCQLTVCYPNFAVRTRPGTPVGHEPGTVGFWRKNGLATRRVSKRGVFRRTNRRRRGDAVHPAQALQAIDLRARQQPLAAEQPRFGGRSLVRYTADLGLLSERMNVIHAVWVDDADLDLAAAGVLWGTFFHNGQVCESGTRALVSRKIYDEFVGLLVERAGKIVIGDNMDYDGATSNGTYTGSARLIQEQTSVKGDSIVIDNKAGNLGAAGNVATGPRRRETCFTSWIRRKASYLSRQNSGE